MRAYRKIWLYIGLTFSRMGARGVIYYIMGAFFVWLMGEEGSASYLHTLRVLSGLLCAGICYIFIEPWFIARAAKVQVKIENIGKDK